MTALRLRFGGSSCRALIGATLALSTAMLLPAQADAFGTFTNGVLTVSGGEGKIVPRCASDGEITVSGAPVDNGPVYCRDLKRIEASSSVSTLFDFSQLPDNLGGGQGPIEIHAVSTVSDPTEFSDDKFIGAPGHINIFDGGIGFDSITGGNLNDSLSGGADSDKIEGGRGNDFLRGGSAADKLLGGPGRDTLKGGSGSDKLLGGPGRDIETQ
ncbi:MAG TPA: calcium-binding protein [Solirubrobacterales bacterium]|nr:calcium-binding protein [Solirubrobacterales bacterium]